MHGEGFHLKAVPTVHGNAVGTASDALTAHIEGVGHAGSSLGDIGPIRIGDGSIQHEVTPLLEAIKTRDTERAARLIASGVSLEAQDNDGNAPLMRAAWHGRVEIVRLLIAAGADVNAQDNDGATALSIAKLKGNTEMVRLLSEAGAQR